MEICQICNKKFQNMQGLSTHLIHARKKNVLGHDLSIEDYYCKYKMTDSSEPFCQTCGKKVRFRTLGVGYSKYCNNLKCLRFDKNTIEKRKQTCLERYGVDNPMKMDSIKQKIVLSNIEKYGVEWGLQRKDVISSRFETFKEHFLDRLFDMSRLNNKIIPIFSRNEYTRGIDKKYKWKCLTCDFIFEDYLRDGKIPRCPICYPPIIGFSKEEKYISEYIESLGIIVIRNSKRIIPPLELDIYIPSHNLAIEFDGLYWHSEISGNKDKNYHLNKTQMSKSKGIQLLHIFEDEWIDKQEIVKSIISAKLGLITNKIFARKCIVKEVSNNFAKLFLFDNHLQGPINGKHIGLYYKDELVSLLSYGKSRFNKNYQYEILRFCNKINTSVVGGLSKLLKYLKLHSVITYADLRYSNGNVYDVNGFNKIGETPPAYFYLKDNQRLSRLQFQKHLLEDKLEIFDPNLTAWENMQLNNYDRIWDCGTNVYERK